MTEATSNELYRSRSPIIDSRETIPLTMDSKRKATIIQRIEALFPFLEEIMGKNDKRSQEIINKLMALRDGLDGIFEAFGDDLHALEGENEDLRR